MTGLGGPSGLGAQRLAVAPRRPMDYHPIVQAPDGIAAGTDEQPRNQRVYEAGQRGQEQREPEPERMALVLQIGLPNGPWVLEK